MKLDLGVTDFHRIVGRLPEFEFNPKKAALLIVDMHYFQAHRDFGFGKKARELGLNNVIEYYYGRLERQIVPRLRVAIPRLREAGCQIIYCRLLSAKEDGSDFCLRYRSWGLRTLKDSRETEILDEIAPQAGDIVLDKTTQNVFLSTNLDQILRNTGREFLVLAGVVTNNCVEAAARTAVDYSYKVFLLEDCCAAFSEEVHVSALKNIHLNFGIVTQSADLIPRAQRRESRKV
jgi:nicotinamidase-related amidase